MVGFESLTEGVIVLAVYPMYDLLLTQTNNFSGLVRFLPSRLQLVYLLSRIYYCS